MIFSGTKSVNVYIVINHKKDFSHLTLTMCVLLHDQDWKPESLNKEHISKEGHEAEESFKGEVETHSLTEAVKSSLHWMSFSLYVTYLQNFTEMCQCTMTGPPTNGSDMQVELYLTLREYEVRNHENHPLRQAVPLLASMIQCLKFKWLGYCLKKIFPWMDSSSLRCSADGKAAVLSGDLIYIFWWLGQLSYRKYIRKH